MNFCFTRLHRHFSVPMMSDSDDDSNTAPVAEIVVDAKVRSELTSNNVKAIVSFILSRCKNHGGEVTPACGSLAEGARRFDVSLSTISRIWKRARDNFADPDVAAFRASPMKKGRKEGEGLKWNREEVESEIY
jgi:hypothetical protein